MKSLVFFLEEPSAKEMLEGVLPRFLPDHLRIQYFVFQGKQDLEKNLNRKLRAWRVPGSLFIVMRDQDNGDCKAVKARLTDLCSGTGKEKILIRVACRELESFYLGDLAAVEKGLELKGIEKQQGITKYRAPDSLQNPAEELCRLTDQRYQKLAGSRAISPHLNLNHNLSNSFNVLINGIKNLVES